MSRIAKDKDIADRRDKDDPLKGDRSTCSSNKNQNDELILSYEEQQSPSWMILFHVMRKSMWGSLYYSCTGLVGGFLFGGGVGVLVRTTLYLEAIFLLGPLGAATGLLQAGREIVIDSGLAANMGRQVYEKALALVQDEDKSSRNLKEALEDIRQSYPLTDSIQTGGHGRGGIVGAIVQTCMSLVLPMSVSNILDQIEAAIDWAEEHEEKLEDTEIIARATTEYLDDLIQEKQDLLTRAGILCYAGIAGVSLTLSFAFQVLTGTIKKNE